MKSGAKPATIDAYLAALPPDVRRSLERLRKTIKSAAPNAEEGISYQIPVFKHLGRPLVFFAAFEKHCSLFAVSRAILKAFSRELEPYYTSGTTIRFSTTNPLPATLVRKIIRARTKENESRMKRRNK